MVAEIRLPPLGQTSDEMSIVEWYKQEGDRIEIAEPLLCVETDKAQVDVESAEEGIVLKIVPQSTELLSSGTLLAYVGEQGEQIPCADDPSPAAEAPIPAALPAEEPSTQPAAEPAPPASAAQPPSAMAAGSAAEVPPAGSVAGAPAAGRRVRAVPVVRKIAAELGVDLNTVTGTGFGGIIERADVEKAARANSAAANDSTAAPDATQMLSQPTQEVFSDVSPLRRTIARRLTKSVQTIPSFGIGARLDATAARTEIAEHGNGLTYTHLLLRSVARALRAHPPMRRLWVEDGPKYRTLNEPNVGLAVAGDDSLYVVTIPAPDTMALPALIETVSTAAGRARGGALSTDDHAPATITVSNLGMYGVDSFDAIIDPDQIAILAVGSVRDQVVPLAGTLAIGVVPQLSVNLRCDHRSVDGVQAAQFLRTLASFFQTDPAGSSPR